MGVNKDIAVTDKEIDKDPIAQPAAVDDDLQARLDALKK